MKSQLATKQPKGLKDKVISVRLSHDDYEKVTRALGPFTKMTTFIRHLLMDYVSKADCSKGIHVHG